MEIQWKLGSFVKCIFILLGVTLVQCNNRVTVFPDGVWAVGVGYHVVFTCSVLFYVEDYKDRASTHITWLKDGQEINFNPRRYHTIDETRTYSELIFNTTIAEDSGVYTCSATLNSEKGSDSVALNVEVEKPTAPRLVKAVCGRGNHVTVFWEPGPNNNSTVRRYVIEHTNSYTPGVWKEFSAYPHENDLTLLSYFSYGMNYTFRVRAEGVAGLSLPSGHSEICRTEPATPARHPYGVKATEDSPGKMVITWHQMDYNDLSGPGFFYRVYWKVKDHPVWAMSWMTKDVRDWRKTRLVVPIDANFKLFQVKVEAHNSVGKCKEPADIVISEPDHSKDLWGLFEKDEKTMSWVWKILNIFV